MKSNEFRRKETVEISLNNKSSSKSQASSSYYDRMNVGIAAADVWKTAEAALKVTTAVLAVQAGFGIGGVDGSSAPGSGTELQVQGDYNPSKVPEYFIQQERLAQIEKQSQILRAIAEKASKNPDFDRKLLETLKGEEQDNNKGMEHLTPDEKKIEDFRAMAERARKLIEKTKGKGSTEPEQKGSEQAHRQLDNVPASSTVCLDVATSTYSSNPIPMAEGTLFPALGSGLEAYAKINPKVVNKCSEAVNNVGFSVDVTMTCSDPSTQKIAWNHYAPSASPENIPLLGRSQASSQDWEGACISYVGGIATDAVVPQTAVAYVQATGIGATTNALIKSDQIALNLKQS